MQNNQKRTGNAHAVDVEAKVTRRMSSVERLQRSAPDTVTLLVIVASRDSAPEEECRGNGEECV